MARKQHIGIKFPITRESDEKTFFDLTTDPIEAIKSDLLHLIFTPKGQRLRNPNFGTRLIQFMFEPNDNETWGDIEMEIRETVKNFIPNCNILSVRAYDVDNGNGIVMEIQFSVIDSTFGGTYKLITRI